MVYRTPGSLHCIPCLSVNLTLVELSPTLGLTDATLEESLRIPHLSPKIAWPSRQPGEMDGRWLKAANLSHLKGEPFPAWQCWNADPEPGKLHFPPFTCGQLCS